MQETVSKKHRKVETKVKIKNIKKGKQIILFDRVQMEQVKLTQSFEFSIAI